MSVDDFISEWHNANEYVHVTTSGSTGAPKAMQVLKSRMTASAKATCDFLSLKPGDSALLCLPVDFIAGKMMVVRSIHRQMRLTAVNPSGHPLAEAPEMHYDLCAMVPLQIYNTLAEPSECQRLMSIRHVLVGGGAIDASVEAKLREFPNAIWSTYGMTETLSHIALRRISGPNASDWYTPFDGVQTSVGSDGCLIIDAPAVCSETLHTNDIAQVNDNGQFRIFGRKDNTICSGGIKLQIEKIEQLLAPAADFPFMISKKRDPKFGESVAILFENSDISHVKDVVARVLPKYMQPRCYKHVEHLPMTANGKPARASAQLLLED